MRPNTLFSLFLHENGYVNDRKTPGYFVSSLDPDVVPAKEIQAYIRGHLEVENCLHWQKDRYDDEDKHVLRLPGLGDAWTLLTSIALSLGRLLWEGEPTLKEVRESCYIDPIPTPRKLGGIT